MISFSLLTGGQSSKRLAIPEAGLPGTCKPDDYYPTVKDNPVKIGKEEFIGFFTWLYNLKPVYQSKFGDQRYLSGLYEAYLQQLTDKVQNGDHLTEFFRWAYELYPEYREHYGDQGYLAELYDYFLTHNVENTESRKS